MYRQRRDGWKRNTQRSIYSSGYFSSLAVPIWLIQYLPSSIHHQFLQVFNPLKKFLYLVFLYPITTATLQTIMTLILLAFRATHPQVHPLPNCQWSIKNASWTTSFPSFPSLWELLPYLHWIFIFSPASMNVSMVSSFMFCFPSGGNSYGYHGSHHPMTPPPTPSTGHWCREWHLTKARLMRASP